MVLCSRLLITETLQSRDPMGGERVGFTQLPRGHGGKPVMTGLKNFGIFYNFFLITKLSHFITTHLKKKSTVNTIKMINTLNALGGGEQ